MPAYQALRAKRRADADTITQNHSILPKLFCLRVYFRPHDGHPKASGGISSPD